MELKIPELENRITICSLSVTVGPGRSMSISTSPDFGVSKESLQAAEELGYRFLGAIRDRDKRELLAFADALKRRTEESRTQGHQLRQAVKKAIDPHLRLLEGYSREPETDVIARRVE
jgi:hypothetical protein